MKLIQNFILGIQFLTRIPITNKSVPAEPENFRGTLYYFTLIGLLIGGLQWVIFEVSSLFLPEIFSILLVSTAGIVLTGGIHLDGLADIFDGFGAQANRERTFEIMKDSRVGSFGALALMLDFVFHFVGYYTLKNTPQYFILVPMLGKLAICILCKIGKNAKQGMGALWIENISMSGLVFNGIVSFFIVFTVTQQIGRTITILGSVILITYILCRKFTAKLGGLTGDCLGATQQLIEWLALILLAIGM